MVTVQIGGANGGLNGDVNGGAVTVGALYGGLDVGNIVLDPSCTNTDLSCRESQLWYHRSSR